MFDEVLIHTPRDKQISFFVTKVPAIPNDSVIRSDDREMKLSFLMAMFWSLLLTLFVPLQK